MLVLKTSKNATLKNSKKMFYDSKKIKDSKNVVFKNACIQKMR